MAAALMAAGLIVADRPAIAEPGRYAECAGRIVRASSGEEMSFSQIAPDLAKADFVLFGERHGVRQQAQASACVLSAIAASGRPTALVMEMLSVSDQKTIDSWRKKHPETPAGLGTELKWWNRGWPAYDNWLPLLDRAFGLRVSLFGGDLPEGAESRQPVSAREEKRIVGRLGANAPAIISSWQAAMVAAYCGMVKGPKARQRGLAQVRRDLSIADTALEARGENGAVLLQLGRGHARKDRSLYAALSAKTGSIVSIGAFVAEEDIKPSDRQVHDYLWIAGTDAQAGKPCAFGERAASNAGEASP